MNFGLLIRDSSSSCPSPRACLCRLISLSSWPCSSICPTHVNCFFAVLARLPDGTSAATSQKMVCQNTCLEYSSSEYSIVNDTEYCPGPDMTNGNRSYQLVKDYTDCTNWTSLATNDTNSCVEGMINEGNCGYGASTAELCGFCSGSSPDPCCYQCKWPIEVVA